MYPFGTSAGDKNGVTTGDCNVGMAQITVTSGFPFFNAPFKDIYVSLYWYHISKESLLIALHNACYH